MKLKYSVLIVLFTFIFTSNAFALSDNEYKQMMRNPDFAKADKALNNAWSNAKKSLSTYDFEALKEEQREWISKGRDNEAGELINKNSFSKVQAYTIVTKARVSYISNFASRQDIKASHVTKNEENNSMPVLVASKKETTKKTNVTEKTKLVTNTQYTVASGGMRNLLQEFGRAVQNLDLEKVNSLIKEGLNVNDAAYILAGYKLDKPSTKVEDFVVSVIKALARAKANFKYMSLYCSGERCVNEKYMPLFYDKKIPLFYDGKPFSNKILAALLDAGANPDTPKYISVGSLSAFSIEEGSTLFLETIKTLSPQKYIAEEDVLLERLKILLDHKAYTKMYSMSQRALLSVAGSVMGMFKEVDEPTESMNYFLHRRGLGDTSNMTDGNFQSISRVLKVLYNGGADTGEAKDYFNKLRQQHRNIPDAVKYIDDLEKNIKSSWSFW